MILLSTKDGSHSVAASNETEAYHSQNGAITESQHVFISEGLLKCPNQTQPLEILEIGFGTGLNAFLSAQANRPINYTSLEPNPLEENITSQLNYPSFFPESADLFDKIHRSAWNKMETLTENFKLNKIKQKLHLFDNPKEKFNLVYFDAFSPNNQADLWSEECFKKIYISMAKHSILVTYCAKGDVRRRLKKVGFEVERLPGPPGKIHMTRARKLS